MLINTTQHNTTQHNTTQHVDYLGQRLFVKHFKGNLSFILNDKFFLYAISCYEGRVA